MDFTGGCLLILIGSAVMPVSFTDLDNVLPRKTTVYQGQRDIMSRAELQTNKNFLIRVHNQQELPSTMIIPKPKLSTKSNQ